MTDEQKSQHWKDYFAKLYDLTFQQRKKLRFFRDLARKKWPLRGSR